LLIGFIGEFKKFRKNTEVFQKEMRDFKQSTHRSFRQISDTMDVGFTNLSGGLSGVHYDIKEIRDELGEVHETVNGTYNRMDALVAKEETNELEVKSLGAEVDRLKDPEDQPPPPDEI